MKYTVKLVHNKGEAFAYPLATDADILDTVQALVSSLSLLSKPEQGFTLIVTTEKES